MAASKFLKQVAGVLTEEAPVTTSTVDKIPALDGSGKLNLNMMPSGVGPDIDTITTSEALAAGDFVNLHISTGIKVRKADATAAGKEAHGFVVSSFGSAASADVYFTGINTACTGLTAGNPLFLGTSPGLPTPTCPSSSGNVAQSIGVALSATEVAFQPKAPVTLA